MRQNVVRRLPARGGRGQFKSPLAHHNGKGSREGPLRRFHGPPGDLIVDDAKWPHVLTPLVAHVTGLGTEFGPSFEPETVDEDSDLEPQRPGHSRVGGSTCTTSSTSRPPPDRQSKRLNSRH